jgi:uncharacterized membrane protein
MRWLFANPAPVDHEKVIAAIRHAEAHTTGKIRVVLARHRARHPLAAAKKHFVRVGLGETPEHNGVLIFIAPRSRTFAIYADKAVHEKCGQAFWAELTAAMAADFKKGSFTDGIVHGVLTAGDLLAAHFPKR